MNVSAVTLTATDNPKKAESFAATEPRDVGNSVTTAEALDWKIRKHGREFAARNDHCSGKCP